MTIALLAELLKKKASAGDKAKKAPVKDNKATEDKKKAAETESAEKDAECSVSILNIQVGLIRKAWKHPSADRYLATLIALIFILGDV